MAFSYSRMCALSVVTLVVLLNLSVGLLAQDADAPRKETVEFDGHKLWLAFEGKTENELIHETVKEYIPEKQELKTWTRLASIRKYPRLNDPVKVAKGLVGALKRQNPRAPSRTLHDKKENVVLVDFVTWTRDSKYAEFNVFRYSRDPDGGLIAQQYAVRDYDDIPAFLKNLRPLRERLVKAMSEHGLVVKEPSATDDPQ